MPPGADPVRGGEKPPVAGYVSHALCALRENHLIFSRVEPRIISSL